MNPITIKPEETPTIIKLIDAGLLKFSWAKINPKDNTITVRLFEGDGSQPSLFG